MSATVSDLSGQRVLITGGLGFIGSNLAQRCVELGATVSIYDCLDPRSGGNMQNIAEIKKDVNLILNDIRNFEGISSAILDQDLIFSCAAFTSHPQAMKAPLVDIDVNCKGVINILEALRRFNKEAKLVHIGTSTQIGRMVNDPVDELHPEFPVDLYSANKSASEKYVLIYGSAHKLRTTVVRLANNFGPRSNIRNADFGFMNFFIGLGLKNKEITVFGKGAQLRSISYVEDSVEALLLASQTEKTNNQVIFAVSDKQYSVAQVAEAISRNVGGKVRYVEWPKDLEAIDVGDAVISNAKIKSLIDWTPEVEIDSGLQRTKSYYSPVLGEYID